MAEPDFTDAEKVEIRHLLAVGRSTVAKTLATLAKNPYVHGVLMALAASLATYFSIPTPAPKLEVIVGTPVVHPAKVELKERAPSVLPGVSKPKE